MRVRVTPTLLASPPKSAHREIEGDEYSLRRVVVLAVELRGATMVQASGVLQSELALVRRVAQSDDAALQPRLKRYFACCGGPSSPTALTHSCAGDLRRPLL